MNEFLILLGFAVGIATQLRLAHASCHVCEGTGSEVCIWCDGTGNDSVYKGQPFIAAWEGSAAVIAMAAATGQTSTPFVGGTCEQPPP